MAENLLRVGCIVDGAVGTVTAVGEIDASTCSRLQHVVDGVLATRVLVLVLDLQRVEFIESTGLRCLIDTLAVCQERGVRVELVPSEPVRRLLDLCRLPVQSQRSDSFDSPVFEGGRSEANMDAPAREPASL
jgi:anti-anti-sigma factor